MANNNKIGLLDANYIIENSVLYQNIEPKFITPSILRCQNIFIKNILGSTLYNAIVAAYEANMNSNTAIPARFEDLVDTYILPTLMYYVIYDSIDDLRLKITAQGILKPKTVEGGDAPDSAEIDIIKEKQKEKAEYCIIKKFSLENYVVFYDRSLNAITADDTKEPVYGLNGYHPDDIACVQQILDFYNIRLPIIYTNPQGWQ